VHRLPVVRAGGNDLVDRRRQFVEPEADMPERDVRRDAVELDPQPGRVPERAVRVREHPEQVRVLAFG
jgi:hypothetical protein